MVTAASELLRLVIKLAALQLRFGATALDIATLSLEREHDVVAFRADDPDTGFADDDVDTAARAIKAKIADGRDLGFQGMLRLNFPDDAIREMAEAALEAVRDARNERPPSERRTKI